MGELTLNKKRSYTVAITVILLSIIMYLSVKVDCRLHGNQQSVVIVDALIVKIVSFLNKYGFKKGVVEALCIGLTACFLTVWGIYYTLYTNMISSRRINPFFKINIWEEQFYVKGYIYTGCTRFCWALSIWVIYCVCYNMLFSIVVANIIILLSIILALRIHKTHYSIEKSQLGVINKFYKYYIFMEKYADNAVSREYKLDLNRLRHAMEDNLPYEEIQTIGEKLARKIITENKGKDISRVTQRNLFIIFYYFIKYIWCDKEMEMEAEAFFCNMYCFLESQQLQYYNTAEKEICDILTWILLCAFLEDRNPGKFKMAVQVIFDEKSRICKTAKFINAKNQSYVYAREKITAIYWADIYLREVEEAREYICDREEALYTGWQELLDSKYLSDLNKREKKLWDDMLGIYENERNVLTENMKKTVFGLDNDLGRYAGGSYINIYLGGINDGK